MNPARWLVMAAILASIVAPARVAAADTLRVVVRHAGGGDTRALVRLEGQISDLDVEAVASEGKLEKTLDAQIAAASKLAEAENATAVVWFRKDGKALVVVVATPGDRRVFVRTIDAGDESATAEAAAQAARTALRAIALGGTIGVEMPPPPPEPPPPPPPPPPKPKPRARWNAGAGWLVDLDRGSDRGAHALWQRLGVAKGHWGGALELSLGPPQRKDGEIALELSRSSALLALEVRQSGFRFVLGAGVAIYHRTTVDVPAGLEATDSAFQAAPDGLAEVRWALRPGGGSWGIELAVGLDVVYGAPELAVDRGGMVETLANVATFQPRIALGVVVGP